MEHLPDYDDTVQFAGGFHPHLSVGQFQHRSLHAEQQRLQTEWQPVRYEMAAISLIYRSPETDDRFVVAEQFPFQTESIVNTKTLLTLVAMLISHYDVNRHPIKSEVINTIRNGQVERYKIVSP